MNTPLVSIIIPTYNRVHFLGETLDSVMAQDFQNWECLIVDDHSTDHTAEFAEFYVNRDSRFRYLALPSDAVKGSCSARNYGFIKSEGVFIQWFDSDDIMLPGYLSQRLQVFDEHKKMVIGTGCTLSSSLDRGAIFPIDLDASLYNSYVRWKSKILTPSVLFRKSFLQGKDLFNTTLVRGQETELFSRLFFDLKELDFCLVQTPLFLYRKHKQSLSGKNRSYDPELQKSQVFINFENFKRVLHRGDRKLTQLLYKSLIDYFFTAVNNGNLQHAHCIRDELLKIIKNNNLKNRELVQFISILSLKKMPKPVVLELLLKKINIV